MIILVTGGARSGKSSFAERYARHLAGGGSGSGGRTEMGGGNAGETGAGPCRVFYVATSQALDEEMRQRVEMHRRNREKAGMAWETVEEPYELAALLMRLAGNGAADRNAAASLSAFPPARGEGGSGPAGWPDAFRSGMAGEVPGRSAAPQSAGPVILVDCLTFWLSNWLLRCERDGDPQAAVMSRVEELAGRVLPALRGRGHILLVTNEVGDGVVPEYPLGRLFRDLAGAMNQRIAAVSDQVFLVTAGIPVELKRLAFHLPGEEGGGP